MPPITSSKSNEGTRYGFPFIGGIEERLSERLDVSALYNTGLVDADGYLIPGAPLQLVNKELVPIDGADQTVRGVTMEVVKVAESNSQAHLDAANDFDVVIVTTGTIDRAIAEYNLGREYSANELTGLNNSKNLILTDPES